MHVDGLAVDESGGRRERHGRHDADPDRGPRRRRCRPASNRTNAQTEPLQSTGPPDVVMVAATLGVRWAKPDAGTTTDVADPQAVVASEVPMGSAHWASCWVEPAVAVIHASTV